MHLRSGLRPEPRRGSLQHSPRPSSLLPHYLFPADPLSAFDLEFQDLLLDKIRAKLMGSVCNQNCCTGFRFKAKVTLAYGVSFSAPRPMVNISRLSQNSKTFPFSCLLLVLFHIDSAIMHCVNVQMCSVDRSYSSPVTTVGSVRRRVAAVEKLWKTMKKFIVHSCYHRARFASLVVSSSW